MEKKLKYYNGREQGLFKNFCISVCAYSRKQAAELISIACSSYTQPHEINKYFSECWGNDMKDISRDEIAVYGSYSFKGIPYLLYKPGAKSYFSISLYDDADTKENQYWISRFKEHKFYSNESLSIVLNNHLKQYARHLLSDVCVTEWTMDDEDVIQQFNLSDLLLASH